MAVVRRAENRLIATVGVRMTRWLRRRGSSASGRRTSERSSPPRARSRPVCGPEVRTLAWTSTRPSRKSWRGGAWARAFVTADPKDPAVRSGESARGGRRPRRPRGRNRPPGRSRGARAAVPLRRAAALQPRAPVAPPGRPRRLSPPQGSARWGDAPRPHADAIRARQRANHQRSSRSSQRRYRLRGIRWRVSLACSRQGRRGAHGSSLTALRRCCAQRRLRSPRARGGSAGRTASPRPSPRREGRARASAPGSSRLAAPASIGPLSCGVSIWSTSCPASGGRRALLADTDAASVAAILAHLGLATEPPLVARARDPSADAA